jgi:predicted RNase H-like HicB family nuclease
MSEPMSLREINAGDPLLEAVIFLLHGCGDPQGEELALRIQKQYEFEPSVSYSTESKIRICREDDGRWIAENLELPGVMAYGDTELEAVSKMMELAVRVVAGKASMSRTTKHCPVPWRDREFPWRSYTDGPPAWYRRIHNRKLRLKQNREAKATGEIASIWKRSIGWLWW